VVPEKAGGVWRVQPPLHLPGGIGGVRHPGSEIIEEVTQQQ
jgi:hypothetical protein